MNRLSFLVVEFGRARLAFPLWVLEEVLAFLLAGALLFRGRVGPALFYLFRRRLGLSAYRKGEEVFTVRGLRVWIWRPF